MFGSRVGTIISTVAMWTLLLLADLRLAGPDGLGG